MTETLRIMALPVDDGGCGHYRVRQPFEALKRFTPHDAHIWDKDKDDAMVVAQMLKDYGQIMVFRPGAEEGVRQMKEIPEFAHLKWVLDIDDNIELINPLSGHYREHGQEEVQYHDGRWLWQDGKNGFDLKANRRRVSSLLAAMEEADLVTVTTDKLADYARVYNSRVAVLPNCINLERWWPLPFRPNKRLRVGWSGGQSHYEDWYTIKEPLNELMRRYQFQLVVAGSSFDGIVDEDNKHLLEVHDWVPFKGHSYRMMCLNLDVALIPLKDMEFNHYKSSVKWYEFSAMGVPSVVANILPYSEDIEPGKTAWAYRNPKEFAAALTEALDNRAKRRQVGRAARKWVEDHRDWKKEIDRWAKAYASLLS